MSHAWPGGGDRGVGVRGEGKVMVGGMGGGGDGGRVRRRWWWQGGEG